MRATLFGGVVIGKDAFVGNRTRLSNHTIVGVGAKVAHRVVAGRETVIGAGARIDKMVTLGQRSRIRQRCIRAIPRDGSLTVARIDKGAFVPPPATAS